MGNDVDGEGDAAVGEAFHVVDGERDAVEGDRPLGGDVAGKLAPRDEADAQRIADRLDRRDLADAVDMAGDDMAAKLVADLSARSRLSDAPSAQSPGAVRLCVSAETSTANQFSPLSTTVRQTPEQAIDAPRSTSERS